MELEEYLVAIRRHWRAFSLIIAACLALAWIATLLMPRVYTANASGQVSAGATSGVAEASIADTLAKSRAKSYLDVAKSRAVAQRVIDTLHLTTSPSALIGSVVVTQPTDTVVVNVSATASSPEAASNLADAWVHALAAQVEEMENPGGKSTDALRVVPVEAAAVPTSPSSPRPLVNLAAGAALGLLLAFGYIVLAARFDRRLRTADDVVRNFDVTIAGAIPRSASLARQAGEQHPIVVGSADRTQDAGGVSEAFRKLRTNLQFMRVDDPPRIIAITSPLPADGKSTVAMNLAAAFALAGTPTILIDGDLRRPVLASTLGLEAGPGLSNLLAGQLPIAEALQPVPEVANLSILTSGTIPPNPSELLGSTAMNRLLSALSQRYFVVIDAPPLLPVTDAAVLTANCDGALVIISEGKTKDNELGSALNHLARVNGTVLGVVVNKSSSAANKSSYYSGYYASYYTAGEKQADAAARGATAKASKRGGRARSGSTEAPRPRRSDEAGSPSKL